MGHFSGVHEDTAFSADTASGALRTRHHSGFEQEIHQIASLLNLKTMMFPVFYNLNIHGVGLLLGNGLSR